MVGRQGDPVGRKRQEDLEAQDPCGGNKVGDWRGKGEGVVCESLHLIKDLVL